MKRFHFLPIVVIKGVVLSFLIISFFTCNMFNFGEISAKGKIEVLEVSTWMYGSHILLDENGSSSYALTSDIIDLNKYNNSVVTVYGDLIDGYPVDSGPEYLNVTYIKKM